MSKVKEYKDVVLKRLAAEKKKSVIAFTLVSLMLFMWIRVFTGSGPQQANAMPQMQELNTGQKSPAVQVSFIELPEVRGKNDKLTGDFFSPSGWEGFPVDNGENSKSKKVNFLSEDTGSRAIEEVAKKLTLEAIELGDRPRAFINNKSLLIGEKLRIRSGQKMYMFEVMDIEQNQVVLRCESVKVKLNLGSVFESAR